MQVYVMTSVRPANCMLQDFHTVIFLEAVKNDKCQTLQDGCAH